MTVPKYQPLFLPSFARDLRRFDSGIQERILQAINQNLVRDPFRYSKKLVGGTSPGRWRFRVGSYRIRFDIEGNHLIFFRVRHRKEIYE